MGLWGLGVEVWRCGWARELVSGAGSVDVVAMRYVGFVGCVDCVVMHV